MVKRVRRVLAPFIWKLAAAVEPDWTFQHNPMSQQWYSHNDLLKILRALGANV